ncbi:MAG TPA: M2 family metallopeptidase, partial [Bryobacteraceae bacterium]|nr:M2 family metallopeptidase [Bryobacteraceae bacterium]
MKPTALVAAVLACVLLVGCAGEGEAEGRRQEAQEFLRMYEEISQPLVTVASEAKWKASTDATESNVGERIGAEEALAAFRGSRYVIENSRRLLEQRAALSDLEFRQLDKILLSAAESPGTIPDLVRARIEAEARLGALRDGFTFCLDSRAGKCVKPVTAYQIDQALATSDSLGERLRIWEASKQDGPALKQGLVEVRDLRNRAATELGYSSYFHLQVADYGMSVAEMMQLMDRVLTDAAPLYRQLHQCARQRLAARYRQPVPDQIPAHWLGDRWGQAWPGVAKNPGLEDTLRGRSPEWILRQAERFFTSLGWPSLPSSYWQKSDFREPPPGSGRKKNRHASSWHVDLDQDVRSLMSIVPNFRWFEQSHHELGHVYYDLAYSNPRVPIVLREGANRAFHEAVADLAAVAARQEPYLRQIGLLPEGQA